MNGVLYNVVFWLFLALVLGIIEAATVNLVTVWWAVSAVLTAILASLGVKMQIQSACFIVFSAVLLVLTRPLVKKFTDKKKIATNADRIIGMTGIVIKEINPLENVGQIKVMGQVWSAKTLSGEKIEEGKEVTVCGLEGVKAVVRRTED